MADALPEPAGGRPEQAPVPPPAGAVVAWAPMPEFDVHHEVSFDEPTAARDADALAADLQAMRAPDRMVPDRMVPDRMVPDRMATDVTAAREPDLLAADQQVPPALLQRLPTDMPPPPAEASARRPRRTGLMVVLGLLLLAGLAAGGFVLYQQSQEGDGDAVAQPAAGAPQPDAGQTAAAAEVADAGKLAAAAPGDAAATTPPTPPVATAAADAGVEAATTDTGSETEPGKLAITTKPAGAAVYIDGGHKGKTPLTIDGWNDTVSLALILPGYKLHTAEIDGSGKHDIALQEAVPPEGPAGIKVRCKKKNRYWVSIDGVETGQLCPTERIGVEVGTHTVEIYDPQSEQRSQFRVQVKGTRNSARVHVD